MQVLGQWVVLAKTINLLPQGGVIALRTCLRQEEIGVRSSERNNEKFSKTMTTPL